MALLAGGVTGCPHRVDFGPQGQITRADRMEALLARRDGQFESLTGDAKLQIHAPQGSGTVSQFLAVRRPASLHIETFDFFGRPVSALVSDGARFSLYDVAHGTYYEGPATAAAMGRFLPVSIAPERVVGLLLGDVPRLAPSDGELTFDADHGVYRLTLEAGGARQVLTIEPPALEITESAVTGLDAADPALRDTTLTLGDYRAAAGRSLAHRISLDAPDAKVALSYRYAGDVRVNTPLDPALFHLSPPPNARVVHLDAQGRTVAPPDPAPQAADAGLH